MVESGPRSQSAWRELHIFRGSSVLLEVVRQSWRSLASVLKEIPCLGLFPRKLLMQSLQAQVFSGRGCCFGTGLAEVTGSGLVPQRLLAQACSLRGCSLVPAPAEVTGSCLVSWRLLAGACSRRGCSLS